MSKQSQEPQVKSNKRIRGTNYNAEEDTQLCNSWVTVSAAGNDQADASFWEDVEADYNKNYVQIYGNPVTERAEGSHKTRFAAITKSINKFHGYYESCLNDPSPNGSSHGALIIKALDMYKKGDRKDRKGFPFLDLWKILEKSDSWKNKFKVSQIRASGKEKKATPIVPVVSVELELEEEVRPVVTKKPKIVEKEERRGEISDLSSSYNAYVILTEKKIKLAEEKMKLDESERKWNREKEILMMDPSTISFEGYRKYVQKKQQTILERLIAEDLAEEQACQRPSIIIAEDEE